MRLPSDLPAALFTSALILSTAFAALDSPAGASTIQHVFVIAMENHDAFQIIGNKKKAPYINGTLLPSSAQAKDFQDEFPELESEPHYLSMEAGTNAFPDHTFKTDDDPSKANSTKNTAHLVTQIRDATTGVTWMTYQEDQSPATGACPIKNGGRYAVRHNPFVFFQDVSGNPPSPTNDYCALHSKPFTSLAPDLAANTIASYVFITPNLCHDMHADYHHKCPHGDKIKAGDDWLAAKLPPIVDWAKQHSGVVFITWDEGEDTSTMPFLAIGTGVKPGYASPARYEHGSIVKSVEEIFDLPVLPTVVADNDLADLFEPGSFP